MSELIDRQSAIDALEKDMASLDQIINGMSAIDVRLDAYVSQRNQVVYDIDTIKQLPLIQPKTGKWKNIVDGIEYTWGTCDTCGAHIPMPYKYYEYCPHCGTKNEVEHV